MDNPKLIYLKNASEDSVFRLSTGVSVYNLEQLLEEIKKSNDAFYYHVTDSKNDFANWIRVIIGYTELADNLATITDRIEFINVSIQSLLDLKSCFAILDQSFFVNGK